MSDPTAWTTTPFNMPEGHLGTSTVPERFRSTSTPIPGHSLVPPEFSSTSAPAQPAADPTPQYR